MSVDDLIGIEINDDKATKTGTYEYGYRCVYGSIVMPSSSTKDIEYEYKIKILKSSGTGIDIGIGIDDAKCKNNDKDFVGNDNTENYAYYSVFGSIYNKRISQAGRGEKYGEKYGEGDIISMCYNPYKETLLFSKNDVDQGEINNIVASQGLEYRLCVFLPGNASVQLL